MPERSKQRNTGMLFQPTTSSPATEEKEETQEKEPEQQAPIAETPAAPKPKATRSSAKAEIAKEVAEQQAADPAPAVTAVVVDQQTPQPPAPVQAPQAPATQPEPTPAEKPEEPDAEPIHWGFRDQQDRFVKPKLRPQEQTPPLKDSRSQLATQMTYINMRIFPLVLHACEHFDGKNNAMNAILAKGLQAMGYDVTPETLNVRFRWSDVPRVEGLSPESVQEIKKNLPKGIDY